MMKEKFDIKPPVSDGENPQENKEIKQTKQESPSHKSAREEKPKKDADVDTKIKFVRKHPESVSENNERVKRYTHLMEIRDWTDKIKLNPFKEEHFYNRGMAKRMLGRYEEAIEDFDKAIKLNPSYEKAFYKRAVAKFHLGQYDKALEDLDEAIKINPSNEKTARMRNLLWEEVISGKSPENRSEEFESSRYHRQLKREIKDCDEILMSDPSNKGAFWDRVDAENKLEKYVKSVKKTIISWGSVIKDCKEDPELFYSRSLCHLKIEQYKEALKDSNEVIRLCPANEFIKDFRAGIIRKLEQSDN